MRLMVRDKPGVLAEVCQALAAENISISSVVQHEPKEEGSDQTLPLVIVTHYAETGRFRAAVKVIDKLPALGEKATAYSVDD